MAKIDRKVVVIGLAVVVVAVVAIALLLSSDEDTIDEPEAITQTTLTVSGSGGTVAILEGVQARFAADVPGYELDILPGSGTGAGVKGVADGILDMVAMARPPKDNEPVEYLEFGQSGQSFITHPDVGITGLTSEQFTSIIMGEITNWSEVGGPDMAIIVYVRDEGDSTTKALRDGVLGDEEFPATAQVLTSQGDMISAVENTQGSIGMCTWPAAAAMGAKVTMLLLDGVSPADPAYPIQNAVGVGYSADNQEHVQPLLDWLVSEEGQAALLDVDVLITQ